MILKIYSLRKVLLHYLIIQKVQTNGTKIIQYIQQIYIQLLLTSNTVLTATGERVTKLGWGSQLICYLDQAFWSGQLPNDVTNPLTYSMLTESSIFFINKLTT